MRVKPEEAIFQHLPLQYRKAGQQGTAAFALTAALGRAIGDMERASRQVLQSRFLDHLNDMDDLERLAALFALSPWPEEGLDDFRFRVRQMAQIYLQGAATAKAMLLTLGAACDAELIKVEPPPFALSAKEKRFETVGTFRRRETPQGSTDTFTGVVVDAPLITRSVLIDSPQFEWQVENSLYVDPGGLDEDGNLHPEALPDPVVDLVAGDHPVVLPILVQRDLRRLVVINRAIPPGATLRVDLVEHKLTDVAGPVTLEGPLRYKGEAPPLLYGTGGLVHDPKSGQLTGIGSGATKARPFHIIRWNKAYRRDPSMPEVPGPPGNLDHVPLVNIPWPELLPFGTSRWALLVGVGPGDEVPALDAALPHTHMRALPATPALGPRQIQFRWSGRRLATFTIRFDEPQLCDGPEAVGPMAHRAAWLREQVERLKLAGVIYLDQHEVGDPVPAPAEREGLALSLWEAARSTDEGQAAVQLVKRYVAFGENLILQDHVSVSVIRKEK